MNQTKNLLQIEPIPVCPTLQALSRDAGQQRRRQQRTLPCSHNEFECSLSARSQRLPIGLADAGGRVRQCIQYITGTTPYGSNGTDEKDNIRYRLRFMDPMDERFNLLGTCDGMSWMCISQQLRHPLAVSTGTSY